jgi:soluble lytic murein transglycosylase-like protein
MNDIKLVAAKVAGALQHMWERLSATQQIMARGIGLFAFLAFIGGAVGGWAPAALVPYEGSFYNGSSAVSDFIRARELAEESNVGELELARLRLARAEAVFQYSAKYEIPANLAELIFDVASREGLDPDLAFRLVKVESGFNVQARSRANAYGLAQVQLATARFYEADITTEKLLEPERNLRIGFRYLRYLMEHYEDINLALLAYNRGPSRVNDLMDAGRDPDNGYPGVLMEGYTGGSR